ncbi:mlrC family protein [Ralstonia insidiosa]|uniref:Microcystinase C n=1 Tax=Ralstonia insidiosa TaxID=190721 RepID=A0AAC9FTX8_9RALS|nr:MULTISPECIES: M81 family metallopeptidase [Ralstonia]ANH75797.1 mlrC family protein [Ralstonia insidiosa]EPX99105.1 MlrC domain-containing protein [Ralstonia sp. AU12-08]MBY4707155.1 M81 family metallopeptidase [Ralstonia insidiosa]GAQ29661.1 mlrC domain-containing protein [Ralstonia sp. NT80]
MRILIARFNHETNTFSPVPTPLASFHPHYGADAYRAAKGTRTAAGAFIDLAEAAGAEIVVPVIAGANPSGRVAAEAYTTLCDAIVAAAPGCDALMLDLHGAMVAENSDDGEGDLLERLRAVVPDVPITVALDLHGNLTQKFIDLADIAVSFKTYPHVDMYETGEHAGRLLFDKLAGRANPVLTWRRLPMVTHTLRSRTDEGAMHRAVALAKQAEQDGMLAVSILAGFGLADIAAPCLSIVVVGNGDAQAADAVAQRIADAIWSDREGFVYRSEPLAESIARAAELAATPGKGPVLLLDHGDNCMSGGTCDDMHVLHEALKQGLSGIAVGPVCDPEAVAAMIEAGVGATVTLPVGDKVPLTQLGVYPVSRVLKGKVAAISDGEYTITGPTYTGQRIRMGRTALLDIGAAQVVVTETPQEHWDLGIFTHIGVDPHAARFVLLKSRMYCRPVFVPIAKAVVECDGGGVTSSDYSRFPFAALKRPVFPLDAVTLSSVS